MRKAMMHGWYSYLIIQMHPTLVPIQTFDVCNSSKLLLLQRWYWLFSISRSAPRFGQVCCIYSRQLASRNMVGGLLEGAAIQKERIEETVTRLEGIQWIGNTTNAVSTNVYFKVAALRCSSVLKLLVNKGEWPTLFNLFKELLEKFE